MGSKYRKKGIVSFLGDINFSKQWVLIAEIRHLTALYAFYKLLFYISSFTLIKIL